LNTTIRLAEPRDAEAIAELLIELGYDVALDRVRDTLTTSSRDSDPVFLALINDTIVAMIALHIARWIQLEKPIARIPAMIVRSKYQRRGIGRRLLERALAHARGLGCGTIELTSANDRDDAHAFYRDMGFEQTSLRFKRTL
jgi:GNAT superfamily N-acetyltransferase